MKEIEFDVELTVKDLYAFSMRHAYVGVSGIFGLLISLGSWILLIVQFSGLDMSARVVLFVIGCLFTIVQPIMLYSKARTQIRRNQNINSVLHYRLTEEGITISQGEQEASVKWYEVRKRVVTKSAMYLYMSPVRAFIFPKEQCGELFQSICETVTEQIRKYQNYEPEFVEEDAPAEENREQ